MLLLESLDIQETPVVFRLLGELYYKNKDYEKSQQCLKKAYSEFKFDTEFLCSIFMADLATNKLDDAKNTLEQLKKTNPAFPGIVQFQTIVKNFNPNNRNAVVEVN